MRVNSDKPKRVFAVPPAHHQDLNVGHQAPALEVVKWVKGQPVRQFEKGKVYVVEFWATWCGPCKRSIPHLTELAHQYAGKATFVGVDVFDQSPEPTDLSYLKKVSAFVQTQGKNMDYRVAADGPNNAMATNWLKAYGEAGIPSSFIVDGTGTVAWIGNPQEGLDEALKGVLARTNDIGKAASDRLVAKRQEEAQLPIQSRMMSFVNKKDWQNARALSDTMMASDPKNAKTYAGVRFLILLHTDPDDAYNYATTLRTGQYKGIAPALTGMARQIAEEPDLTKRDLDLALSLAQESVDLTQGNDPRELETLAIVDFKRGDRDRAVDVMTKAIKAEDSDTRGSQGFKNELLKRLASFQTRN